MARQHNTGRMYACHRLLHHGRRLWIVKTDNREVRHSLSDQRRTRPFSLPHSMDRREKVVPMRSQCQGIFIAVSEGMLSFCEYLEDLQFTTSSLWRANVLTYLVKDGPLLLLLLAPFR